LGGIFGQVFLLPTLRVMLPHTRTKAFVGRYIGTIFVDIFKENFRLTHEICNAPQYLDVTVSHDTQGDFNFADLPALTHALSRWNLSLPSPAEKIT